MEEGEEEEEGRGDDDEIVKVILTGLVSLHTLNFYFTYILVI